MLQDVVRGFKEEDADLQTRSSQRDELLFEVGKKTTFTNVDHEGRATDPLVVVVSNEATERRQQGYRKIVYTEVPEILERVGSGGHSRTAQAGNDYDIGNVAQRLIICAFLWLWFDQSIVPVVAFVDHAEALCVGVAKDQKLICFS